MHCSPGSSDHRNRSYLIDASLFGFIACVALAVYAQNATGFAFGLILLGLAAVFDLASVQDAANAATVLTLVNAWAYFRNRGADVPWRLMRPALLGSTVGVIAGVTVLTWLSGNAVEYLRALLGVSILACAALLALQRAQRATLSSPSTLAGVGVLSGVLSGLFASGGPPLVYHLYRQPLPQERVRHALLLVFAVTSLIRLAVVLPTGQFSPRAAVLSVAAVPVVYGVTWWQRRRPPPFTPRQLRWAVGGLLALAGVSLLVTAIRALSAGAP